MAARAAQRKALIVGLGKTGLSVARYLRSQGCVIAVTDSRDNPPGLDALRTELPDAAVFVGGFSEAAFEHADFVVVSPGVPLTDPFLQKLRRRNVEIIGDVELFARAVAHPVIAITGSNGKSTVTTLVAAMTERAGRKTGVGGNLGVPALELLNTAADIYVLELSSFQLESTRTLAPAAAAILNVTPDHIDWHGDMPSYARAKGRVFQNAAICVFNRDDAWSTRLAQDMPHAISFGLDAPPRDIDFGIREHQGVAWLARGAENLLPVSALRISGAHNQANALAALALGNAVALPQDAMLDALREFAGLPHRMTHVADIDGVRYVDDSKGTNVGASVAAIRGADRPVVLIAGGDGKGQDFAEFAEAMLSRVRYVVLLGKSADDIAAAIASRIPCRRVAGMEDAVLAASEVARPGDMVLLSPACSSLDMFSGFDARGRAFADAVARMAR